MLIYDTRLVCCICGASDLEKKLTIKNFPVYMGVTDSAKDSDLYSHQTWTECQSCGCLQLRDLLSLNLIYQANHHTEVVGEVWHDHHIAFSDFIARSKPSKIIEIGAAHGYLAALLIEKLSNIEYTIIEPNSSLVDDRIKIIKGFVEDNFSEIAGKNCIIHSHVLEHIYKPVEFIKQISMSADMDCEMYVSFPNFHGLIESGSLNSLNFEHTYLLDMNHAELIFQNAGFSILESSNYLDHSYFYRLKKVSKEVNKSQKFSNVSSQSQKFLEMVLGLKKFVESANLEIANHVGPIYIFGAHIFTQALLTFGLDQSKILGILDNSIGKQNKRLYGTNFRVFSPLEIKNQDNVIVILKASHYQEEIRSQLKYLNNQIAILE